MRVLGLIPARAGSKGIPGKNIKPLGGKPLIVHTIERALEAMHLDEVMVSTEDDAIAGIAIKAGAVVPFMRSEDLAGDQVPTVSVVEEVLKQYEFRQKKFDAVCLLQPTTPFRPVGMIDAALEKFELSGADSLISVRPVPHEYNPHWIFERKGQTSFLKLSTGEQSPISRRQDLPHAYYRDGAIYITRIDVLQRTSSLYGRRIAYLVNDQENHVNLDTPEDWRRAERCILDQSGQNR